MKPEEGIDAAKALKKTRYILTSSRSTLRKKDEEAAEGKVLHTLNIIKVDSAKTDVRLSGAVIGVYSDAECTNKLAEVTTDAMGSASCKLDRNVSRLYLKELKAPEGYRLTKTVYTVDMPDGDSVSVMIKNEQQFAGLKITKKGEVLTGADIDNL